MKEFIELVKKLWSNKRYRSLVILLLYFVFFIFVFMIINSSTNNGYTKPTGIDAIKEAENYKVIVGDKEVYFDNGKIVYENETYGEIPLELQEYNLNVLTPSNIYNLYKNSTLESTNYTLNTDTYVIKVSEFEKKFNNIEIENNEYIKLIVYKDNYNKFIVDFSNYYGYIITIEIGG